MEEYNKRTFSDNKVKIIYKKNGKTVLELNGTELACIKGYTLQHDCDSIQSINFNMYCECEIEVEK